MGVLHSVAIVHYIYIFRVTLTLVTCKILLVRNSVHLTIKRIPGVQWSAYTLCKRLGLKATLVRIVYHDVQLKSASIQLNG